MEHLLQPALAQLAIALSVFSLITYLWLGLTVLLIGNRASRVTWIGGIGLLTAAVFFLCHGALVGAGVPVGPSASDVWWRLAWVPSFLAPILWAAIGLHYAGLEGSSVRTRRLRRPALIGAGALGVLAAVLALASWPAIGRYGDFIRLLGAALRLRGVPQSPPPPASPLLPVLALAFIAYMAACALLPWASLAARRLRPTPRAATAGSDGTQLWDAADAWNHSRRALLGASLCMIAAGAVAAVVGIGASIGERHPGAAASTNGATVGALGHVPLVLVAADLIVQVALAGLGLLLGWAVVRQGVLVERQLPQAGFFRQWRGTALVALVLAVVVAGMALIEPEALPYLLVLVTLVTATYALFTWQAYGEHDRLLAQLRPFAASLSVGYAGWLASDPREVERSVEALFISLCRDVLGAAWGQLSLSAGRLHRTFAYSEPREANGGEEVRHEDSGPAWTLPVMDEHGVVARLVLGPRGDGAGYTAADLEIARACGQRILDAVGEYAATQAIASLARRRGLEAELSAALPRRVLHDEVLPRLHLAMLRLEALRAREGNGERGGRGGIAENAEQRESEEKPQRTQRDAEAERESVGASGGRPVRGGESANAHGVRPGGVHPACTAVADDGGVSGDTTGATARELGEVVAELGRAHRDLAALMRATPAANPRRVEHGLVGALRSSLEGEFRGTFDALEWDVAPEHAAAADALSPVAADLLLGAALEAVRNAGRHGRGEDLHRRLTLRVAVVADSGTVTVAVSDDGVGLQKEAGRAAKSIPSDTSPNPAVAANGSHGGTRTGLLTHGALVALVGGALTVRSNPDGGTTVTVRMPRAGIGTG
ncbi:MAG TPA: ATP-binding protein [Ktedonobacterales bacterium]|nr:ATP-binding protein [Ktedonobacterales bacterium]